MSTPAHQRARTAHAAVLAALSPIGTARNIAQVLGLSEPTISKTKGEIEDVLVLLYHLGFKVVSEDKVCVSRDRYEAMTTIASAALADPETAKRLIWEAD